MKTDVLTVLDTHNDASTGFYVNGSKVGEVHCNDEHEIPELLYDLMVRHNFLRVEHKRLSDVGFGKYDQGGWEHPDILADYGPDDFEGSA